jgi:hypothetical protein
VFGAKRRKAVRDAKIRVMMAFPDEKLAALVFAENQDTADMAQAVIVVKWLAEHGYLPIGAKKTEDE